MEFKGQAINRPSMFKGEKYETWKLKMIIFLEYNCIDLLEVIENDIPSLFDDNGN